jgi:hypothetical protein
MATVRIRKPLPYGYRKKKYELKGTINSRVSLDLLLIQTDISLFFHIHLYAVLENCMITVKLFPIKGNRLSL